MGSTAIIRSLDHLGRIVLPAELRNVMDIKVRDALEIFYDGKVVILKKYSPACILCDNAEDVIFFKGKKVCKCCIEEIAEKRIM